MVWQRPGGGPFSRCPKAREFGWYGAAWRCACFGRRRSWLPILHPCTPERAGVRRGTDADSQPGNAAGLSGSRTLRLCAFPLFRVLGRLQGDFRNGGEFGLHLQRSVARVGGAAIGFRIAAGRTEYQVARPTARTGAAASWSKNGRHCSIRARQPARSYRARQQTGSARHHGHRQGLPGFTAGAGGSRNYRARSSEAGFAHL